MKFLENLFGKKYLEWDEYQNMIDDIDNKAFKNKIKQQNEKIRKEAFKDTNFSG
ncbi:hypothetical protein KY345_04490 [Candidatus Woesearchaeota archaeon]|nr:hypothetical protein [Candidatus Woesearchaeota archaeon]